MTAVNARD